MVNQKTWDCSPKINDWFAVRFFSYSDWQATGQAQFGTQPLITVSVNLVNRRQQRVVNYHKLVTAKRE